MSLAPTRPSRRTFLKQSAALSGAFVLGIQGAAANPGAAEVTHWVVIAPDDTVTIRIARSELGQGTFTGLAQLVAEELACDWSKVRPEYADVNEHIRRNKIWKDMSTGGSRGIRDSHDYVRKGGAAARMMLIAAAAQQWEVPVSECRAENGQVIHSSGKKLRYGELAALASTLPVPENPSLKNPKDWKIAGTSPARFDIPAKVNGSQIYASDIRLPGMLHASILQSPVFGGFLKNHDDSAAKAMPGVKHVVTGDDWVAVLATNWWQANEALKKVKVSWENGNKDRVSSDSIMANLREGLTQTNAPIARKDGDVDKAFANAHKVLEAEYYTGFMNHATMEPQNAAALYTADKLEVWVGTQNGESSIAAAADASGLPLKKFISIKCMLVVDLVDVARIRISLNKPSKSRWPCPVRPSACNGRVKKTCVRAATVRYLWSRFAERSTKMVSGSVGTCGSRINRLRLRFTRNSSRMGLTKLIPEFLETTRTQFRISPTSM